MCVCMCLSVFVCLIKFIFSLVHLNLNLNSNWQLNVLFCRLYDIHGFAHDFHGCFAHNELSHYGYSIVTGHLSQQFLHHHNDYVLGPMFDFSGPYRATNGRISLFYSNLLSTID